MKDTIITQYYNWLNKHNWNRFPKYFNPYNCAEIKDYSQSITAACGISTSSAALFILEIKDEHTL